MTERILFSIFAVFAVVLLIALVYVLKNIDRDKSGTRSASHD
jgi:hypothetical protein